MVCSPDGISVRHDEPVEGDGKPRLTEGVHALASPRTFVPEGIRRCWRSTSISSRAESDREAQFGFDRNDIVLGVLHDASYVRCRVCRDLTKGQGTEDDHRDNPQARRFRETDITFIPFLLYESSGFL